MVRKAEHYRWSSAAAHCQTCAGSKTESNFLTTKSTWKRKFDSIENGSAWLAKGEDFEALRILRRNADKGLLCGSERIPWVFRSNTASTRLRETHYRDFWYYSALF